MVQIFLKHLLHEICQSETQFFKKKHNPLDVSNYSPVSILSIVSKILERSIFFQLNEFLTKTICCMNINQISEVDIPQTHV